MPCRFASSGTVATSRSASRAILALNAASNFLRDLVISVLHRLRQSRTLHTLTFGPISGVHFTNDDKQPDEHHKKRPVDLHINLFRSHAPREQQESTTHNSHLGDWLAEEEQHDHNRQNNNGLRQQRS